MQMLSMNQLGRLVDELNWTEVDVEDEQTLYVVARTALSITNDNYSRASMQDAAFDLVRQIKFVLAQRTEEY